MDPNPRFLGTLTSPSSAIHARKPILENRTNTDWPPSSKVGHGSGKEEDEMPFGGHPNKADIDAAENFFKKYLASQSVGGNRHE